MTNVRIKFDFTKTAAGLGISFDETISYFLDGRKISFLLEQRLSKLSGYTKAPSESSPFDVIDDEGKKAEVRCLTNKIIFRPSDQIGMGRRFCEQSFYDDKIAKVDYFIICDVNEKDLRDGFVDTFSVDSNEIWCMYKCGLLGKNAEKSRKTFLKLMIERKLYT